MARTSGTPVRPGATPAPVVSAKPTSVYLGVWQPGAPQDMAALDQFERDAGKHVAIVQWYETWNDVTGSPDIALIRRVAARGSVPLITWQPEAASKGINQPDFALKYIADGRYDGYARRWAQQLAAYGGPVLLRWAHEMNGDWYPWGVGVNENSPAQFIAAWRRLHDIFTAAGAHNVQWVWSPNISVDHDLPLESLYPGDTYVDWLALDAFNRWLWGWRSFSQIFTDSYNRITALSTKPLMLAETATSENPPAPNAQTKGQWITASLVDALPRSFPLIRAVVWFNEDKRGKEDDGDNWTIESSDEARRAFAGAVAQPFFQGYWPLTGAVPVAAD